MVERIVAAAPSAFQQGLGISFELDGASVVSRMTATPRVCTTPGYVAAGVLATMADCAGGLRALVTVEPDWTATMMLTTHVIAPFTDPALVAEARLEHRRRNALVVAVDISDGTGSLIASAVGTFADLERDAGSGLAFALSGAAPLGALTMSTDSQPTVAESVGIRTLSAVHAELDLHPGVRNTADALIGGATAVFVESAAVGAADAVASTPMRALSVELHYLGPGRVGPITAIAEVLDVSGSHVRVRLTDTGAADRLVAVAIVTLGPA